MRRSIAQLLFYVLLLAFLATAAKAHQADSSYLRLRLQPGVLEVRITYDVFTLQKIVPNLDADNDGAMSKAELQTATAAIQKFIVENVTLALDGQETGIGEAKEPYWPLDAPDPLPQSKWHDQGGLILFPFDLTLTSPPRDVAVGVDTFPVFGDRHRVFAVFEHGGKSQPVILSVSKATRVFTADAGNSESAPTTPSVEQAEQGSTAGEFFREGVVHILEGYDHIAFLLALLIAARGLKQVVLIVTAFTVAHSITLILAARGIVQLPSRAVECAIAATIVYVAVENLVRREPPYRWGLTFVFGLIHGFGFANVLAELTLPPEALVSSLLLFNVGVEAGQLALVLVLWPLLSLLARFSWGRKLRAGLNVAIGLLGLAWLSDRVFELEWMPF